MTFVFLGKMNQIQIEEKSINTNTINEKKEEKEEREKQQIEKPKKLSIFERIKKKPAGIL